MRVHASLQLDEPVIETAQPPRLTYLLSKQRKNEYAQHCMR